MAIRPRWYTFGEADDGKLFEPIGAHRAKGWTWNLTDDDNNNNDDSNDNDGCDGDDDDDKHRIVYRIAIYLKSPGPSGEKTRYGTKIIIMGDYYIHHPSPPTAQWNEMRMRLSGEGKDERR